MADERELDAGAGWGDPTVPTGGRSPRPRPEEVASGERVAGYVIEGLAGAGGMGVVYRATDPGLGRTVALTLIAPALAGDPALRELFVRESLMAAGLEDPNVIPIYRAGEDDGRLDIAMRFVEGASLEDLIRESGGLPPARAARIVARVADALGAHARGLVHRDVRPANVLIADPAGEEHVYLTDFGVSARAPPRARARRRAGRARAITWPPSRSVAGRSMGAPTSTPSGACSSMPSRDGRRSRPPASRRR